MVLASPGGDTIALLLIGGGLALGLPHATAHSRDRFWYPWVNAGLLPLLIGMAIGPALGGLLSVGTAQALQPFLALALTAAGVLIGTQLRPAPIIAVGSLFITRHALPALLTAALVAVPAALFAVPALGRWSAVAVVGLAAAFALATAERPPRALRQGTRATALAGHVMPAGLWNLIALGGGALALGIGDRPEQSWYGFILALVLPGILGLLLGRSAAGARSPAEAFLFLPAVLALAGGLALALGSAPLLTGIVVGAVLATVGTGRATLVERAISELEQPIAVATGLLTGLCLEVPAEHPAAWLILLVLPLRWLLRGRLGPSAPELVRDRDRRCAPPGAAGVLLVAAASLAPPPLPALVIPLTVALVIGTLVADAAERRP
jgi:hypothetical protein